MKIYAVVDMYDVDGIWIENDGSEDILFASLELAEEHKRQLEAKELEAHNAREAKRYERWTRMNAALTILEANNFDRIEDVIAGSTGKEFSPYEFKSSSVQIIVLEVKE